MAIVKKSPDLDVERNLSSQRENRLVFHADLDVERNLFSLCVNMISKYPNIESLGTSGWDDVAHAYDKYFPYFRNRGLEEYYNDIMFATLREICKRHNDGTHDKPKKPRISV